MVSRQRSPARMLGLGVSVALVGASGGAALADPIPVGEPNGTISGTLDGSAFELPVRCESNAAIGVIVGSHDNTNHGSKTVGGVEPLVSIVAPAGLGFEFIGFLDGKRFKFRSIRDNLDTFPFAFEKTVRDREHGKIPVAFTLDCPTI